MPRVLIFPVSITCLLRRSAVAELQQHHLVRRGLHEEPDGGELVSRGSTK